MEKFENCSFVQNEDCHKTSYTSKVALEEFSGLSDREKTTILLRSGLSEDAVTICSHHKKVLLEKYELFQRKCCDPFAVHKKPFKGKVKNIVYLELLFTI